MANYTAKCEQCESQVRFNSKKTYLENSDKILCYDCKEKAKKAEYDRREQIAIERFSKIEGWKQSNTPAENIYVELKQDVEGKVSRLIRDFESLAENVTRAATTLRQGAAKRKPMESYLGINSCGEIQGRGADVDLQIGALFATLKALNLIERQLTSDLNTPID
jgi:hypothetical protein